MTSDDIVKIYQKRYIEYPRISKTIEAYIQSRVLKKTLEIISFDRRRELENGIDWQNIIERTVEILVDFG